jgi:hypothetical protein
MAMMVQATFQDLSGLDLRRPEYRMEVFQRFYSFHLHYRAHPGAVWYLLPGLADLYGWSEEDAAWFAFLNGNTQNPITSWLLWKQGGPENAIAYWRANYSRLAWDTDRRYHKKSFAEAVESWQAATGPSQAAWWRRPGTWSGLWAQATALHSFGRLSAWSFLEYGYILGLHSVDASSMFFSDKGGSRSHRNGMCILLGLDQYDWHASNPSFDGKYTPQMIDYLESEAIQVLIDAKRRNPERTRDVTFLTLESALCTYKSWHRPNRRYPNVYNDMLHDRIKTAEASFPEEDFGVFWDLRRRNLPDRLLLERTPTDPGVAPAKQNWYRETGEVPMMFVDWPDMKSGFDRGVEEGRWGTR